MCVFFEIWDITGLILIKWRKSIKRSKSYDSVKPWVIQQFPHLDKADKGALWKRSRSKSNMTLLTNSYSVNPFPSPIWMPVTSLHEKWSNYKRMRVTVRFYLHWGFPKALLQCFQHQFLSFFTLNSRHRRACECIHLCRCDIILPNIRISLTKIYTVFGHIKQLSLPRFPFYALFLRFLSEHFPHLPYPGLNWDLSLLQVSIETDTFLPNHRWTR